MNKLSKHLLSILLLVVFVFIAFSSDENTDETTEKEEVSTFDSTLYIIGIAPVDVYLGLEDLGFTTDKNLDPENGCFWFNELEKNGILYSVTTYSTNASNIESIRATLMVDLSQKNIVATKYFFEYISTLPYSKAKPEEAKKWLNANFYNDKASTVIGDVKFTILAPSKAARILEIEKYNPK